jgi:trigger factor
VVTLAGAAADHNKEKKMGNGITHNQRTKPTVKEMKIKADAINDTVAFFQDMLGDKLKSLENQVAAIHRQIETIDTRSVAAVRLLLAKTLVTDDEMRSEMDKVLIETFDRGVAEEDAALGLEATDGPVGAGTTYVMKFETFMDGEKNSALSSPRSQAQFGKGQLPKVFEEGIQGMKAGEAREFEVDAPAEFGPTYKDKKLTFKVEMKSVKKQKPAPVADPSPADAV